MPTDPTEQDQLRATQARLEARIAELEQRQRLLDTWVATSSDFVAVIDTDGSYKDILPTRSVTEEMLQGIGAKMRDVLPPELAEQFQAAIDNTLRTGETTPISYSLPFPDAPHWYMATVSPLSDESVLLISRDVTEQHSLQDALSDVRSFQTLVESTSDGILVSKPDGRITFVNNSLKTMMGWDDGAIASSTSDLFTTDVAELIIQEIRASLQTTRSWKGVLPVRKADGTLWMAQVNINSMYDEQGAATANIGIFRDVTLQQEQEHKLRLFESIIESMQDGVLLTAPSGESLYTNNAFAQMHGLRSPEDFFQYDPAAFLDPEEQERYINEIIPAVEQTGQWNGVLLARRLDGSQWRSLCSIFVVNDPQGGPPRVVTTVRDITDQFQAEQERIVLQSQIIATQQAIVRELSTPLIPLTDDIVVMPLIGTIDTQRAQQIMEVLLEGVAQLGAEQVVIDISGVKVVDTQVADALLRVAKAARLLGSNVALTGISAEVAQSIVHIGSDLSELTTYSTLQSALRSTLQQMGH